MTKPKSNSKTPKVDFFQQHSKDATKQLKDHLISPKTRCFKDGLYRDHPDLYDFYYNNHTGKLVLIRNNEKTGQKEIFSFWKISRMQRVELLNYNHVHRHWKIVDALNKRELEKKALFEAQNVQKPEENSWNEAFSPAEAARNADEYLKKKSKTDNDI